MNSIEAGNVFFRSLATRDSGSELPTRFPLVVAGCAAAGFDLIIAETPGIGQGNAAIIDVADVSLYVMTPEYGAPSQLEKIDMLELADVVAINKFDRRGADDAFRQVSRQWSRDHRDGRAVTRRHRCSARSPPGSTMTGPPRSSSDSRRSWSARALPPRRACSPPPGSARRPAPRPSSHRIGTAIWPTSPPSVRGYHETTARLAAEARQAQQIGAVVALGADRQLDLTSLAGSRRRARRRPRSRRARGFWRSGTTCGPPWSIDDESGSDGDAVRPPCGAHRCRAPASPGWPSPGSPNTVSCCDGCVPSTCPVTSPSPPASSRSSGRGRIRHGCSPARVMPSGPIGASTSSPTVNRRPASRLPSIR